MTKIISLIQNKEYNTAIQSLKNEISGIDWEGCDIGNPTMDRDAEIYSAINNLHAVRLTKDEHFALLAIEQIKALCGDPEAKKRAMDMIEIEAITTDPEAY